LIALFQAKLKPLFTPRFVKFGLVGGTGVVVNLGFLFLFADVLELHTNLASGLAIELSIINNFLINDRWTFADRRHADVPFWRRGMHFHAVSLIGAVVQLLVFVVGNVIWMYLTYSTAQIDSYFATAGSPFERFVVHPFLEPPEVGALKYLSQLAGIGIAVMWNFLANFHWTWRIEGTSK
jgi:putative flippase GtrA